MKRTVCLLFIMLFCLQLHAQRVGLVLSGGGAKGLAHIGVIKALEEENIPIDYITGTSMGAIVGGLYASGYTPDEMIDFVTSEDFLRWSNGEIEEKYIYNFKKREDDASMVNIRFKMKDSTTITQLAGNLVPTHQLDFAAMQIYTAAAAEANYNFDSLFVPFRCVATDIYKNKAEVFRRGDLGSAIRASMTFPFYFKPITIDSVLYFDGGMKDNFPWKPMEEEFNPDFIIGSKTADNSPKPDPDNIIIQLENMLLAKSNYDLDDKGVLIETSFTNVQLLDFDKASYIIEAGYRSAQKAIPEIKRRLDIRENRVALNHKRESYKNLLEPIVFRKIHIEGISSNKRKHLRKLIYRKDTSFSLAEFKREYFKLLADGTISSIYPTARYNHETNLYDLNLRINEESQFIGTLGANISSSSINQGFGSIRYVKMGRFGQQYYGNIYFGRLYSSVKIGARIDVPWRIPVAAKFYFTMNRWDFYNSSDDPFFEDVRPSYLIQDENSVRFSLSTPIRTNSLLETGVSFSDADDEYYQVKEFLKSDTSDHTKFNTYHYKLAYYQNNLNYKQFPTRGIETFIRFSFYDGKETFIPGSTSLVDKKIKNDRNWIQLLLTRDKYFNINNRFTFGYYLELSLSNKELLSNYSSTILNAPAFQPTPHSKTLFIDNYHAHNYFAFGVKPIIHLANNFHLRTEIYGMMPYRKIKRDFNYQAYYGKEFQEPTYMGSINLVYQSMFGPASLGLHYYDKASKNYYFVFNFGYILFNKKGTQ